MDFKKDILDIYFSIYERKPDNKLLVYWSTAIENNEKTISDFVTFITNSNEYKLRILSKFKSVWYEIVGTEFNENEYRNLINNATSVISVSDIETCVKQSDAYNVKVKSIITTVFNSKIDRNPTEEEIEMFSKKFKTLSDYSISRLELEITNNSKNIENIIDEFIANNKIPENEKDFLNTRFKEVINNETEILNLIVNNSISTNITLDLEFIEAFENVFKRNIFIQEYSKYYENRSICDLNELYNVHQKHYNIMQTTLQKYTHYNLSEYEYVKKYLFKVDTVDFIKNFIKNIVHDERYISKMKANINKLYQTLYDEILENTDVDYIFDKLQKNFVNLDDEKIDEYLMEFKKEADEIVNRIFKLYMEIYERSPERNELIEKSLYYRRKYVNLSFDQIDKIIEKELMLCLEFHDIIKNKIRKFKPNITTSDTYKCLSNVIEKLNDLDLISLDTFIMES